jgi:integrase
MSPAAKTTAKTKKRKPKHATWEHPAGSGIKIAEMPNRTGGRVFGVSFQVRIPAELLGVVGKREMHQRKTKAEAERLAEDRFLALRKHGTEFSKIPAAAQKQAAIAWGMLAEHGLDFIGAAEAAIRVLRPAGGQKTLAEVLAELRASKAERMAAGGLDKRTSDDFKSRSLKIEAALGSKPASLVTSEDVEKWLRKLRTEGPDSGTGPLSQRSVLNYRNTLAETFRHAKAKRYCTENPLERFTREDYKALGGEKAERDLDGINILSVEESRKLLNTAAAPEELGMLPSIVLRLFCGIRTAEVCRLDWSEIHWLDPKPYVHIPAGKAKKRSIRHVEIPENALAWLKLCNPPKAGLVVPGNGKVKGYCKRFARLAKLAGLGKADGAGKWVSDWENNDTRHSFGSYHYALHGDAGKTSAQLGHKQGDDVLFAHYRQLVREEQAKDYFSIAPQPAEGKVETFPAAASAS